MSSKNLPKYEHLTGEDLGYEPSAPEEGRFDFSPLGTIFSKGRKEEGKKEGLLKRLKYIEGKNKEQLKAIEDQENKQLNAIKNINTGSKSLKAIGCFSGLSTEEKKLLNEIKEEGNDIDSEKIVCTKSDR